MARRHGASFAGHAIDGAGKERLKINKIYGDVMKNIILSALGFIFSIFLLGSCNAQVFPQVGLIVPAYFDPGSDPTDWSRLAMAATQVPIMAVVNPDSGPGLRFDPDYVAAIDDFDASGGSTLGYVYTLYGHRSLTDVEKDIWTYFAWYPVDGIFIDQMAFNATPKNLKYYIELKNYIRRLYPWAIIVANPGTSFDEAFARARVADVFVDDEDTQINVNATPQPSWEFFYPASMFAEIAVQSQSDPSEAGFLAQRHLGWLYSTTRTLDSNPYAALPADFEQEVATLTTLDGY